MKPGENISFELEGVVHKGLVLPSTDKIVQIKLENGYNIGVDSSKMKNVKVLPKVTSKSSSTEIKSDKKLPKITLISTGGTITSRVDYKTGAVHPLSKPAELLAQIPELSKIANLKIVSPFSVLSEDLTPKDWVKIAKIAVKELNDKSVQGVIITHGTDILHYTASALSFMIGIPSKPVALVGGQRSSDRGSFDGAINLICAVHYCLSDIAAISIIMHENSSDEACLAIRGVKCKKMHTSQRDAFQPINESPLARIFPDGKIEVLNNNYVRRSKAINYASSKLETKVALIKFVPGMDPEILNYYLKQKYKGVILEGTGLGHVSSAWLPTIKKVSKELFIGMTSQCNYGRVDPFVYSTGRLLQEARVVYLEDMLPETAYVKLMWAIANSKSVSVEKLMIGNRAGEISFRINKK